MTVMRMGPKYSTRNTVVQEICMPKSLKYKVTSFSVLLPKYSSIFFVLSANAAPLCSPTVKRILSAPIPLLANNDMDFLFTYRYLCTLSTEFS